MFFCKFQTLWFYKRSELGFANWFIWFKTKLISQTPRNWGNVNTCPLSKQRGTKFLQKNLLGAYSTAIRFLSRLSRGMFLLASNFYSSLCNSHNWNLQLLYAQQSSHWLLVLSSLPYLKPRFEPFLSRKSTTFCPFSGYEIAAYTQIITL